ncbi:DUF6543 domain-containing protein [Pseudomonas sp. TAE6080]|uniref:dermonecrotic toxin domain-containing protein n=1 Tax=Pseudomonas sp. TAE6080 TaxID=2840374 RepID=UPI001C004751|nr:DUF6543 domain-containing protein [Pseudomonas sp. TAE6080]MBT9299613.1 hypothetical protein [Pseudomonas sp. TAE6080]
MSVHAQSFSLAAYRSFVPTEESSPRTPASSTRSTRSIGDVDNHHSLTLAGPEPIGATNGYAAISEQAAKANVEKAKFKNIALVTAATFPDVRAEAKRCAQEIVFKLTGKHVDADKTYLNRFNGTQSAATATGWEHMKEEPTSSISLTDAVLKNFSEYDGIPGTLDSEAGLYTDGPGQSTKAGYGAHNEIPLAPSDFMKALWKADFQTIMSQTIDDFWQDHADNYRTVLKGVFIYKASEQLKSQEAKLPVERALQPPEHQFTQSDYKQLMRAVNGEEVPENQPVSFEQLQAISPVTGDVQAHAFDINGFKSNDIVRFTLPGEGPKKYVNGRLDGVQILYIPDAEPAFLKFTSLKKMDQWVSDQGRTPQLRKALESHFTLADRQNHESGGFWKTLLDIVLPLTSLIPEARPEEGVDASLESLGTGSVSNQEGKVIDRSNFAIKGDVFSHMANLSQQRMKNDADTAIQSNSEVTRDTWLNDISVGAGLLVKLAPLGVPVAAAALFTSLTEVALGAEKEVSGDTQAERHEGTSKAFDGMLNALFSSMGASSKAEDPFALPKEEPPTLEPPDEPASESTPGNAGVEAPNRLQPSQAGNISAYAVVDGESLLAKSTVNAKGIYQFKDELGVDRWFIRYTDQSGIAQTYEIKSDFKLSDDYVQIIDPQSGNPILTVGAVANGEWRASRMLGGINGSDTEVSTGQKRPAEPGSSSGRSTSDGQSASKRPKLPEAFPGEKATLEPPVKGKNMFYKYNNQSRHSGFAADRFFSPSSTDLKGGPLPRGQGRHYFTDLAPEDKPTAVISEIIFGRNRYGKTLSKMTNYYEVNTTGLELVQVPGHPHIFYVDTPFSIPLQYKSGSNGELMNRVISRGETPYTA